MSAQVHHDPRLCSKYNLPWTAQPVSHYAKLRLAWVLREGYGAARQLGSHHANVGYKHVRACILMHMNTHAEMQTHGMCHVWILARSNICKDARIQKKTCRSHCGDQSELVCDKHWEETDATSSFFFITLQTQVYSASKLSFAPHLVLLQQKWIWLSVVCVCSLIHKLSLSLCFQFVCSCPDPWLDCLPVNHHQ